MNWEAAGVAVVAVTAIVGANNYILKLHIKAAIADQSNDLKNWINGSFMRAKEVGTKIEAIESRLDRLEEKR